MHGVVKRWGGSLAIRIDPAQGRQSGLREGMEIDFDLRPRPVDFSKLPTFDDDPDAAARHDELLDERD